MDWGELQEDIRRRARGVADLLRHSSHEQEVQGSDWTAAEVGAHLVSVPRRYMRMMQHPEPFPDSLSALNEAEIHAVGSDDLHELAEMLIADVEELLRCLGLDGAASVPFFSMQHTAEGVGAVMLGELLLHGLDLAHTLDRPWDISRDEASTVLGGLLPSIGYSVDPDVAERAPGTYHLRIRDGHDWTIHVEDRAASVDKGPPSRADLHVSADPLAFLLVGYGRTNRWRPLLTGKMIAWGRRPHLAAHFSKMFKET